MQIFQNIRNLTRSTALIASLYIVFVSCSKEEEPEPEPPKLIPEITAITPTAGFVGMHVVITGKNFSEVHEENIVRFAGIDAKVVDADENSIEVVVPPGGTTGTISVKANDGTVIGPSFKYHDLFLLGNQIVESTGQPTKNYVRFWRNGIVTNISDQTSYNYGYSFAVSGDDIFISGFHFDGSIGHAVYWKNTTVHTLSPGQSNATDISVDGNDAYVSGILHNGTHWIGSYWKNESDPVKLTEDDLASNAGGIHVANGNVFVGGSVATSNETSKSALWKNASNETIDEVAGNNNILDVVVAGQDVHMAGSRIEDSKVYVTYWKNGVAKDITSGQYTAAPTSISIIDGDVYITGYEHTSSGISQGKVWNVTKDQAIPVPGGSIAVGIAKVDDLLVICGQGSTAQGLPFYIINGEYFPVTEMGASVQIHGIYVK